MQTLDALQSSFQRYLLDGGADIVTTIAGTDDDFRRTRLNIYYHAYRLRLVAALGVDFPVLKTLVGEQRFDHIARAYVAAHPSAFRNLRWFGQFLPGYLRAHSQFSSEPVLAELADFEWAQGLAFDASDAPQLGLPALTAVPPEGWGNLRFMAHPSLHLVKPLCNIVSIWHAHNNGEALPSVVSSEIPSVIAIWRRDFKTWFRTLDSDEAALWTWLSSGCSFGDACAMYAQTADRTDADAAQRAAGLLGTWINDGWIQSFKLPRSGQNELGPRAG